MFFDLILINIICKIVVYLIILFCMFIIDLKLLVGEFNDVNIVF